LPRSGHLELERIAHLEVQRHEGARAAHAALLVMPGTHEVGQPRVAPVVAQRLQLGVQRPHRAAFVLGADRSLKTAHGVRPAAAASVAAARRSSQGLVILVGRA
jgi:hypothetical protein